MDSSYIQNLFAGRIGGKFYGKHDISSKFSGIRRAKKQAQEKNPHIALIDLGVGEPDDMVDTKIIKTLQLESEKYHNKQYANNGSMALRVAIATHMKKTFGVTLEPKREIVHTIGSKSALSILPYCFINNDDFAIVTDPGYPTFPTHVKYCGGKVFKLPLLKKNNFLPIVRDIPRDILKRSKVIIINYPNNPTGTCATKELFEEIIEFAKENKLIVIHDAAYALLNFSDKPSSILQIPGAKEIAVEIHSFSKSFSMTGWRLGWVCGNDLIVKAFGDVKSNTDAGQFLAIQKAGITALEHPEIPKSMAKKYSHRMDMIIKLFQQFGFKIPKPKGGCFLYVQSPLNVKSKKTGETVQFPTASAFSKWLVEEKSIVCVPWDEQGNFVRFSVTFNAKNLEEEIKIIEEIKKRLSRYIFSF